MAVEEVSGGGEYRGVVDAEDGGEPRSIDLGLDAPSLYGVLDSVEEEKATEEVEEVAFYRGGDEGFEVEKVELGLVIDFFRCRGGDRGEGVGDLLGEVGHWIWVGCVERDLFGATFKACGRVHVYTRFFL